MGLPQAVDATNYTHYCDIRNMVAVIYTTVAMRLRCGSPAVHTEGEEPTVHVVINSGVWRPWSQLARV